MALVLRHDLQLTEVAALLPQGLPQRELTLLGHACVLAKAVRLGRSAARFLVTRMHLS